jgi:precorrin-6B methylase 2
MRRLEIRETIRVRAGAVSASARVRIMKTEHALMGKIKARFVKDRSSATRVKAGLPRGAYLMLNRRHDIQREWGLWETELNGAYKRLISADGVVFDIGAGDGYTTLGFARLASRGTVVAFDPDRTALEMLDQNLSLNRDLAERIRVVGRALSHSDFGSLPDPTFIKIDVDGAEVEVLRELHPFLEHHPPVLVETHSAELEAEAQRTLREFGYETCIIKNARWRLVWPEYRPIGFNRWLLGTAADRQA